MAGYATSGLVRLAKRDGNAKRSFLLVNPLQAKHVPVSPSSAWDMMSALADSMRLDESELAFLAFAETATAIGAVVAYCANPDSFFIHSTRAAAVPGSSYLDFEEEHSHAAKHRIMADNLMSVIPNIDKLIFVDDEYSTGKTLLNVWAALNSACDCSRIRFHAISIVNRMTRENSGKLVENGIDVGQLLKLPATDLTNIVEAIDGISALPVRANCFVEPMVVDCRNSIDDPRKGLRIGNYYHQAMQLAEDLVCYAQERFERGSSLATIGTEECMFPALVVGKELEKAGYDVVCHSSTRSPISISSAEGYPITCGYAFESPYEAGRKTFIYNVRDLDAAFVISDADLANGAGSPGGLLSAIAEGGCRRFIWVMI